MNSETKFKNHELDIDFVKQFGGIPNNEVQLVQKQIITNEKLNQCSTLFSELFLEEYSKELKDIQD